MSELKIYDERLKNLEHECNVCRDSSKMYGTGYLIYSKLSDDWIIEFYCPVFNEKSKIWHVQYEKLIQQILKEKIDLK